MSDNPIQVENVTKVFGDFVAVDHVSFEVQPGEVFGWLAAIPNLKLNQVKEERFPSRQP
jgi:ABC-type branched-subunit amino acid transport system ATPase component